MKRRIPVRCFIFFMFLFLGFFVTPALKIEAAGVTYLSNTKDATKEKGLSNLGTPLKFNVNRFEVLDRSSKVGIKNSDGVATVYLKGLSGDGFDDDEHTICCRFRNVATINGAQYDAVIWFDMGLYGYKKDLKPSYNYRMFSVSRSGLSIGSTSYQLPIFDPDIPEHYADYLNQYISMQWILVPNTAPSDYTLWDIDVPMVIVQKFEDVDIYRSVADTVDDVERWSFQEFEGGLFLFDRAKTTINDKRAMRVESFSSDHFEVYANYKGLSTNSSGYTINAGSQHETGWNESLFRTGGYVVSTNNQGTSEYGGINCNSVLSLYVQTQPEKPKKNVSTTKVHPGDQAVWTIEQPVMNTTETVATTLGMRLSRMIFTDNLPADLTYVSHSVTKNGRNVAGTFHRNGQTLTFTVASSELNSASFYDGTPVKMTITTKVVDAPSVGKIQNTATVNTIIAETVTATTDVYVNIYTSHEGSGTITPNVLDLPWGNNNTTISYAPSKYWYTKEMHQGNQTDWNGSTKGASLGEHYTGSNLKPKLTSTRLVNIKRNMHVHAVFVPIPELTVQKAIEGTKSYSSFGSPLFYYKIAGTDYLGNNHTWYLTIPGEGTLKRKVPAGDYTVTELPVDRWELVGAENVKNFSNVGISNRGGICNLKNGLPTDTPGSSAGDGHIRFTNKLTDWEDFGHNSQVENKLK